jgi:triosephosphate isomerase
MTPMRGKLVAGNWKMHGSLAANAALLGALRSAGSAAMPDAAVCVPFPYLAQARELLRGSPVALGAQDVSEHPQGAFTGEVSAAMLAELGCKHVIVGHSERRTLHAEDSGLVGRKARSARSAGLTPIVCVGETLAQRESGKTEAVVAEQIDALLEEAGVAVVAQSVIAYEPVWAIGTGKTASPEQAQAVHRFIRSRIRSTDASIAEALRILYGGSVKANNAAELFAMPDIDGGLVGGASLDAKEFIEIMRAALPGV